METLISVLNFEDAEKGTEINSPRTLEACLRAGYDPSELLPKSKKQFKERGFTEDMVDIKFNTFERKRQDKIAVVTSEREAIIAYQDRHQNYGTQNTATVETGQKTSQENVDHMLEMEQKRMEALRNRQEKELAKIVQREQAMAALQAKIAKAEHEEMRKKKEHEKKVAEQKAQAEKKKQQRAFEKARQEQEEAEKKREMMKKEAEFDRKKKKLEEEAQRKLLAEAREREAERERKMEEHRQKTEALLQAQIALAEENRIKMQEREERVNAQLEAKKVKKSEEIQHKRELASKRIGEALEKHHAMHEQKKLAFHAHQQEAIKRAKELEIAEREKLKKQAEDRERKNRLRQSRLVDAYRQRNDHRNEIVRRRNEKDKTFGKLQEEREEQNRYRKFHNDLKKTDKQENVERVARMNEFHRLQTLQAIHEADMRYERIQEQRNDLMKKHREEAKQSLTRKHAISNAMDLMRVTNDYTLLDQLFTDKKSRRKKKNRGEDGDNDDPRLNQTV